MERDNLAGRIGGLRDRLTIYLLREDFRRVLDFIPHFLEIVNGEDVSHMPDIECPMIFAKALFKLERYEEAYEWCKYAYERCEHPAGLIFFVEKNINEEKYREAIKCYNSFIDALEENGRNVVSEDMNYSSQLSMALGDIIDNCDQRDDLFS